MIIKAVHVLQMTWMFIWRLVIVDAIFLGGRGVENIFLISLVAAVVIAFGFKKTILFWPLARLFMKRRVIIPSTEWARDAGLEPEEQAKKAKSEPVPTTQFRSPEVSETVIGSAIEKGRITGFEPTTLEALPIPDVFMMKGTPGAGLNNAEGMEQVNIELGIKGESNFARALSVAGLINRFATVWSVPVPDKNSFVLAQYSADIDCVLATNETIFLIDLKYYKSGAVRYYNKGSQLYCEDSMTGQQVGDPRTMSMNMSSATEALRGHFPTVNFTPVVVFMPTDNGEGFIDNVFWTGNIPAMNLSQFLYKVKTESDFDWRTTPHAGTVGRIEHLLDMKRKPPKKVIY
jgi:hypothetical protein